MNQYNSDFLNALSIPNIPKERQYWFVRTNGGDHYDDFTLHSYIAIAWDDITLDLFRNTDEELVKSNIRMQEKISPTRDDDNEDMLPSDAGKATSIYNKIARFINEMQIDDIVLVPSKNSSTISIGLITSDVYEKPDYFNMYMLENPDTELKICPYHKRRNIKWLKHITKNNLDIFLAKAIHSQHSVSNLNDSAPFINRSIYDIYSIDNQTHAIIRTEKAGGISLAELKMLINSIDDVLKDISTYSGIDYNSNNLEVKISMNSPGLFEVAGSVALISASFALVVFALGHYKHGGKQSTKLKFGFGETHSFEFSSESEGKGSEEYKLENRKMDLENIKRFAELEESLKLKLPAIDSSFVEFEDVVDK